MAKKNTNKKRGNPSRKQLYGQASQHAQEAMNKLVWLMRNGDNHNVRLGAANSILDRCIPKLRQQEIVGGGGEPIIVKIIGDYAPKRGGDVSPPKASPKD